jgi:hypothetical protein
MHLQAPSAVHLASTMQPLPPLPLPGLPSAPSRADAAGQPAVLVCADPEPPRQIPPASVGAGDLHTAAAAPVSGPERSML